MLPLFQDNFILGEATSSHFFRVTTSTQQLLFRGSYFFVTAAFFLLFQNSYFFAGAKLPQSSHFLIIGSSLLQLLLGTVFFSKELFTIKISTEELLFRSRYFCTASFISEELHFGEKRIFQKSNTPHYLLFLESCLLEELLFQKTLPSIAATFSEEPLYYNILFQKSYYFTATVPFHIYASYLFVSN